MIETALDNVKKGSNFWFHKIAFKKISNTVITPPLHRCPPCCVNLSNGHKCVISSNAIVSVESEEDLRGE